MYYRFPFLLLIILALAAGLTYFGLKAGHRVEAPAEGQRLLPAADTSASPTAGFNSVTERELRAHVRFLADDLLQGRDTGSRGARLAALYLANQFEQMGLQPAGDNGTFFQTVPLRRVRPSQQTRVSVEIDGEMVPLRYGEDFLVLSAPEQSEELTLDLVFTGFGIQAPEYNYDDFGGVDVSGKATLYLSGEPSSPDSGFFAGAKRTRYSSGRVKRQIAAGLGARAVLGILKPADLERVSWEAFRRFFSESQVQLADTVGQAPSLPGLMLHPNVGEMLFSGADQSFADVVQQAASGRLQSFDLKRRVRLHLVLDSEAFSDANVAAWLPGSDPVLKEECVVVSAHYDHLGIGPPVRGDSIYNGAADNASGVAGLLELAEAFASLPQPPRRSVLFLGFTAEEEGLLGSEYYVRHPIVPLTHTVANFNLDIIGLGDTTGVVIYGAERSSLGEVVQAALEQVGLRALPDELPEQRIFYRSDHFNFARRGVPAVMPGFGLSRDRFGQFETYYHTPADDVELPFNYRYMKRHVQAVFLAVRAVANADTRPRWVEGDEFERAGGSQN